MSVECLALNPNIDDRELTSMFLKIQEYYFQIALMPR